MERDRNDYKRQIVKIPALFSTVNVLAAVSDGKLIFRQCSGLPQIASKLSFFLADLVRLYPKVHKS